MGEPSMSKFLEILKSPGRNEEERFKDIGNAIALVTEQLRTMKAQDKFIMKKFVEIRSEINRIKQQNNETNENQPRRGSLDMPRIVEDDEFLGARDSIVDPFDVDDNVPLRRRAITTTAYSSNSLLLVGLDKKPKSRYQTR